MVIACHGNAQEIVKIAKASYGKFTVKGASDIVKQTRGRGSEDDIINVKENVAELRPTLENEQRGVEQGSYKADGTKEVSKTLIPRSRGLFQVVEGFVKMTNIGRTRGINEPHQLLTKDGFIKMTVEKCVFDVKLVYGPRVRSRNAENNTDIRRFDNWSKCLIIVESSLLSIATNNPMSLVASQGAIKMKFVLQDPLVGDNVAPGRGGMRDQV